LLHAQQQLVISADHPRFASIGDFLRAVLIFLRSGETLSAPSRYYFLIIIVTLCDLKAEERDWFLGKDNYHLSFITGETAVWANPGPG